MTWHAVRPVGAYPLVFQATFDRVRGLGLEGHWQRVMDCPAEVDVRRGLVHGRQWARLVEGNNDEWCVQWRRARPAAGEAPLGLYMRVVPVVKLQNIC